MNTNTTPPTIKRMTRHSLSNSSQLCTRLLDANKSVFASIDARCRSNRAPIIEHELKRSAINPRSFSNSRRQGSSLVRNRAIMSASRNSASSASRHGPGLLLGSSAKVYAPIQRDLFRLWSRCGTKQLDAISDSHIHSPTFVIF
jgi:hypothetical protein